MRTRWRSEKFSDATLFLQLHQFEISSSWVIPWVNHFCDPWFKGVIVPCRWSNLEVKKKSPLFRSRRAQAKAWKHSIHESWVSPQYNVLSLSQGSIGRTKFFLGEMSPFYREGTSPILRHLVSVTFSPLIDIGLGIHWGCPLTRSRVACMPL